MAAALVGGVNKFYASRKGKGQNLFPFLFTSCSTILLIGIISKFSVVRKYHDRSACLASISLTRGWHDNMPPELIKQLVSQEKCLGKWMEKSLGSWVERL